MSERDEQDVVDRATDALRAERVPPVPPGLVAQTQSKVRDAARVSSELTLFRHPLLRIAAAVLLLAGAGAVYVAVRGSGATDVASKQTPDTREPAVRSGDDRLAKPAPSPVRIVHSDDAAGIRGRVKFAGVAPRPQVMSMAENAHCKAHHRGQITDESVVVNPDGSLRNVVVWVSGGLEGKTFAPPKEPAVLDQQGCVYTPHVVTVMTGQRLLVKNSDPFLHNVRAAAASNPPFNFGQPTVDGGKPLVFLSPERLFVKCDIHPWMSAFVHVLDNPFFAVTGADGTFALPAELPPGKYTLSAWHEVYGEQSQTVTIEPGKPLKLEFTFQPEERAAVDASAVPAS